MTAGERLKLIGASLVFLVGGYLLAIPVLFLGASAGLEPADTLSAAALQSVALLAGYGTLTWLIGKKALRLPGRELERLDPRASWSRRWGTAGFGLLLGAGLATLAMIVAVPLGKAAWSADGGSPIEWGETVALTGAVLLPAALAEELAFRGVPLVAVARAVGRLPAVIGLALLFGLAHLGNPGVTPLAIINISLAGIFLGLVFFTAGGLWTATGAHLGWNLTLASLAAPVSGFPLPMPGLDYRSGGPEWLTGGSFGPEGGVLASLCLVAGSLVAARRGHAKKAGPA